MKTHRNDHLRAAVLTLAWLAMVSPAAGAEPQADQPVLAQQILGDDEDALVGAIRAIRNISPEDLSPELRAAILEKIRRNADYYAQRDAAMERSNEWIEPLGTERRYYIFEMFPFVASLRDPDTISALIIGINDPISREALAEFGEEAVPALLDAVMSGNSPDRRVAGSLIALRFMVEGAAPKPLSAETRTQIRRAAEHRLTTGSDRNSGSGIILFAASDLAFALDDPGLWRIVETLATDPDAIGALGVAPEVVERTRQHLLDRLDGVPPLLQRRGLDADLARRQN